MDLLIWNPKTFRTILYIGVGSQLEVHTEGFL